MELPHPTRQNVDNIFGATIDFVHLPASPATLVQSHPRFLSLRRDFTGKENNKDGRK
jgi:hypothetical protein